VSTDDVHTEVDPLGSPRTVRMARRFDAPRSRVYRSWTVPEELVRWFPQRIEGSLAAGTRSVLIFPDQRVWWDPNRPEAVGLLFRQTCSPGPSADPAWCQNG